AATRRGPRAFAPGARSLLALDRRRARELAWIRFGSGPVARGPLRTAEEPPPARIERMMSGTP
ncbi:AAA family ATPase, partial [Nocardiopsis dassonvillei]|nr:AAA family ATPase [Nocardiopsis dassonvillei]